MRGRSGLTVNGYRLSGFSYQLTVNSYQSGIWLLPFIALFVMFSHMRVGLAQDAPLGAVSGKITNATAASSVPPALTISLFVRDQTGATVQKLDSVTQADGSYRFEAVPMVAEYEYVTAVVYRDQVFSSSFIKGDPTTAALDLPIQIYELTEDLSVLTISGTVAQVSVVGETLEVRQVVRFRNSSDRLFTTTSATGDGRFASVLVTLPPGAQVVNFDNPARYIVSQQDFTVLDTTPVLPGNDHLVVVVYVLPYDGSPALIEQAMNYPFDGEARLLVSGDGLQVKSEQLPSLGNETVGEKAYRAFGGTLQLQPGEIIGYELSGGAAAQSSDNATSSNSLLVVLTALIGLVLVGLGVALYMRGRQRQTINPDQLIDALVQQIEGLDRQHAAGTVAHDLWQRQRATLQARLDELLGGGRV
jgi:hypothetical protein